MKATIGAAGCRAAGAGRREDFERIQGGQTMKKLACMVFGLLTAILVLLPGTGVAKLATNHNRTRLPR